MTIKTTTTVTKEANIPVPCFWKNQEVESSYRAILDEKTFVAVHKGTFHSSLVNGDASFCEDQIIEAHNEWNVCTEDEFMDAYLSLYESMNLSPVKI